MLGTKAKFSTAFQLQIDGQTKVVNRSLSKSLHDIIYDFRSRHPIYLIPIESASSYTSLSASPLALSFA